MNYPITKLPLLIIILISLLMTGCSVTKKIPVPDSIIDIHHNYEIDQNKKLCTVKVEVKNTTKYDLKKVNIHLSSESIHLIKSYEVPMIGPGKDKNISFIINDNLYPKDLRIYVTGYYYVISKDTHFIYDYPLAPKLNL
ncbi:MAG: hypothetical protein FWC60_11835 [Firmicutes bacterium]|nr:hypothetical protein [Bacillota bacterium]